MGPEAVAAQVTALKPRLVGMVVFGHQPSASTQQMTGAGPICRAIKAHNAAQQIIVVGGHVAALPERTMNEESVDFACTGEGPITIHQLMQALDSVSDFSRVEGLVWRERPSPAESDPGTNQGSGCGSARQRMAPPAHGEIPGA